MTERGKTRPFAAHVRAGAETLPRALELIREEPFLIRVDDRPYSVVMRTPGDELAHAAGFCLGEGIVSDPGDIETLGYDEELDPNIVDVWLRPERHDQIHDRLERRFFVSQTSCGVCGKELIQDLQQILVPTENLFELPLDRAFDCIRKLSDSQKHYQTTRGSHASLLFDGELDVLAFAEDVGRHNALDKAIGKAFLAGEVTSARLAVLSSRISYELVQKAARARLPMMLSESRPTSLAVEIGQALGMTLAYPDGDSELVVVCGRERILPVRAWPGAQSQPSTRPQDGRRVAL